MTTAPVLPGAEPLSAVGTNGFGALVLHGFTGSPQSMRGIAEAFAGAGYSVEMPLLPGHGTSVEDMLTTGWADWSGHAEATYVALAERVNRVVVIGLSMGGTLSAWLATRHGDIAGLVLINGALEPMHPDVRGMFQGMADAGGTLIPGIGSDIAMPDTHELAYAETPISGLLSLAAGGDELDAELGSITMPSLVMYSPQDHVVPVTAAPHYAAKVAGAVEMVVLERSYHVATLDYDRDLIIERALAFAAKVCAS